MTLTELDDTAVAALAKLVEGTTLREKNIIMRMIVRGIVVKVVVPNVSRMSLQVVRAAAHCLKMWWLFEKMKIDATTMGMMALKHVKLCQTCGRSPLDTQLIKYFGKSGDRRFHCELFWIPFSKSGDRQIEVMDWRKKLGKPMLNN